MVFFEEFSKKGGLPEYEAAFAQFQELESQIDALAKRRENDSNSVNDQALEDTLEETSQFLSKTFQDLQNLEVGELVFIASLNRIAGVRSRCGVANENSFASLVIADAVVAYVVQEMLKALPPCPDAPRAIPEEHPDFIKFKEADTAYRQISKEYDRSKKQIEAGTEAFIKNIIIEFNKNNKPGLLFVYDSENDNGLDFEINPDFKLYLQEKLNLLLTQTQDSRQASESRELQRPDVQGLLSPNHQEPPNQEAQKLSSQELQKPQTSKQELQKLKQQLHPQGLESGEIKKRKLTVMGEDVVVSVVKDSKSKQELPFLPITPWLDGILTSDFKKFQENFVSTVKKSEQQNQQLRKLELYAQLSLSIKHVSEKIRILQSIVNDKDEKPTVKGNSQIQINNCNEILISLNNFKNLLKKQLQDKSTDSNATILSKRYGSFRAPVIINESIQPKATQIENELGGMLGLQGATESENSTGCLIS